MTRLPLLRIVLFSLGVLAISSQGMDWPQLRGSGGNGNGGTAEPPVFFGPGSNQLWKANLASGNSSPIVWGERVVVTTFDKSHLETVCLDRRNGNVVWRKSAPASKFEATHRLGNPATPTPCTDGNRVYVSFGSFGLLAYDLNGAELWKKPLPTPQVEFGTSSSPIVVGDRVILLCDQDQGSYLLAVSAATGETLWRVERPEFRRGFATPYLWEHSGKTELVVPGSIQLKSYNPENGKELWSYTGTSRVANTMPGAEGDCLIYSSWNIGADPGSRVRMESAKEVFPSYDQNKDGKLSREEIPAGPVRERFSQMDLNLDGFVVPAEWDMMREMFEHTENALVAINAGGKGEVRDSHLRWKQTRSLPYVSSPLVYRGRVFTMKSGGLASCYDLKSGKPFFQDERVGVVGDYYSSAVAAGDKIFLGAQNGTMLVLRATDHLEVLAKNELSEPIMATPALVDGIIYIRAGESLYAFGSSR